MGTPACGCVRGEINLPFMTYCTQEGVFLKGSEQSNPVELSSPTRSRHAGHINGSVLRLGLILLCQEISFSSLKPRESQEHRSHWKPVGFKLLFFISIEKAVMFISFFTDKKFQKQNL